MFRATDDRSFGVTFPSGSLDPKGIARRWNHNDTITVVADDAARAIEMVRQQWPDVRVWTVNHIGSRTILMADIEAPKPAFVGSAVNPPLFPDGYPKTEVVTTTLPPATTP